MRRLRIVVGLLVACVGSSGLRAVDLAVLGAAWPYLLAAYAVAAAVVAIVRPAVVAVPLVAGSVAAIVLSPVDLVSLWPFPALVAGLVIAIRNPAGPTSGESLLALGWTVRATLDTPPAEPVGVVAVAGVADLDLRGCSLDDDALSLTMSPYAGSARVDVPRHWRVLLVDTPPASVGLRESGRRDDVGSDSPLLRLRVRGLAGAVVIHRW